MIEATNTGDWKARIHRTPWAGSLEIYLYRWRNGRTELLTPDGIKCIEEGAALYQGDVQPVLRLNGINAKAMMVALAEAISEEGIRTPDSHRLQGTLDAQAAHLEDLRTLLKLNKTLGVTK